MYNLHTSNAFLILISSKDVTVTVSGPPVCPAVTRASVTADPTSSGTSVVPALLRGKLLPHKNKINWFIISLKGLITPSVRSVTVTLTASLRTSSPWAAAPACPRASSASARTPSLGGSATRASLCSGTSGPQTLWAVTPATVRGMEPLAVLVSVISLMVSVPVKQLWVMKSVASVRYAVTYLLWSTWASFSLLLNLLDFRMDSLVSLPTNCLDARTVTVTLEALSISWALCLTVTRTTASACARTGWEAGSATKWWTCTTCPASTSTSTRSRTATGWTAAPWGLTSSSQDSQARICHCTLFVSCCL